VDETVLEVVGLVEDDVVRQELASGNTCTLRVQLEECSIMS
jgi:hypothetical protein